MRRLSLVALRDSLAGAAVMAVALIACACGDDDSRTGMRFSLQPTSVFAGQPITVAVEILDVNDVRVVTSNDTITISTEDGTPVGGTKTVAAIAGLATFSNLAITKASSNVRLIAASRSLSAISNVFAVSAGPPSAQSSSIAPSTPVTTAVPRSLTFKFADAFENPIPSQPITLASNLTGVTLAPSAGTTTSNGSFSTLLTATTAGEVTIAATVAGVPLTFAPLVVQPPCTPAMLSLPGTVTGTMPTQSCVVASVPTFPFRFTTSTHGAAAFSLLSAFSSALDVTTEPPADAVVLRGGPTQTGEWLLPPGTYLVRVGAVSGAGDFNLMATSGAGNQGQVIRNIIVGGEFAQSLGSGDFTFPEIFGDNSFWDVFRMRSSAACTITAHATGTTGLDLLMVVADSVGNLESGDDNSGGGTDPQITLNPCQISGGPVRVMVNHYLDIAGGPYTLTVSFAAGPSARGVDLRASLPSWDAFKLQLRAAKRR